MYNNLKNKKMKTAFIIENEQGLAFSASEVKTQTISCEGVTDEGIEIGFLIAHLEKDDLQPDNSLVISMSIAETKTLAKVLEDLCNQATCHLKSMKNDTF